MDEATRRAHLERLRNPKMPNPFFSWDYGVPVRELPPRRTLGERMRRLVRRRPQEDADRSDHRRR